MSDLTEKELEQLEADEAAEREEEAEEEELSQPLDTDTQEGYEHEILRNA